MARGNRVDVFVRRPICAAAKRQEAGNVLLVEIRNSGFFHQRLQTVGPLNASVLHVIVKRTNTCKITCEDGCAVNVIADNQAPVADQVNQAFSAPTIVSSACDCLISGLAIQRQSQ